MTEVYCNGKRNNQYKYNPFKQECLQINYGKESC